MDPAVDEPLMPAAPSEYAAVTYSQIIKNFLLMGWTAFGGPQAHIALFETVRVLQRTERWVYVARRRDSTRAVPRSTCLCCTRQLAALTSFVWDNFM